MTSDQKTFNMKVVRLVETVKIAFGLFFIRDRLPPQKGLIITAKAFPIALSKVHIYLGSFAYFILGLHLVSIETCVF